MFFILSLIFLSLSIGFFIYIAAVYIDPVVYVFRYAFRSFFPDTGEVDFPAAAPAETWQIICLIVSVILFITGMCMYLYWFSNNGLEPFLKIHFIISATGVCAVTLPSFFYNFITEKMNDKAEVLLFYEKYSGMAKIIAIFGTAVLFINIVIMIIRTKHIYPLFVFPFHILFGLLISLLILAAVYIVFLIIGIAVAVIIGLSLGAGQGQNTGNTVLINGVKHDVKTDGSGNILYEYDNYGNKYAVGKNGKRYKL